MPIETESLGRCTECGTAYPLYRESEKWHPVGTDGSCQCGNREFTSMSFERTVPD